ncbi:MAG: YggS family pyridoxal phosphate-dependent enzyme [Ruminococcus sp.]|nr:YggS family pyridoxal phosphate-dependent enzyme [Ruminococcus sp.]
MDNYCPETIRENIRVIRENIAEACEKYGNEKNTELMAVTKTVPPEIVNLVFGEGLYLLGENRVQEYLGKRESYDLKEHDGIVPQVHFIGNLQTNKVKYIIDDIDMIQSVDSLKLAQEINRLASAHNKIMDVLCEVNIGGEDTKGGITPADTISLIEQLAPVEGIRVRGLMTIPPPVDSDVYFGRMAELFNKIKDRNIEGVSMDVLSMGMTHDYVNAVKFGSTVVRVGTGIFGRRTYI